MSGAWKAPAGWASLRKRVFARDGHVCWRCGGFGNSIDHIRPVALGGSHDLQNLRVACSKCNSSAGAALGNRLSPRTPPWKRQGMPQRRSPRRW
jgi:5-methylcytosine-specific restriction endonuclease McrA